MSAKKTLTDFIRGNHPDPVIVSPVFSETWPRAMAQLPPDCPQDDPRMLEAKLHWAEEAGFPPVIKYETNSLDLITKQQEIVEQSPGRTVIRFRHETSRGPYGWISTYTPQSSHSVMDPPLPTGEVVQRQRAMYEELADFSRFRAKLGQLLAAIGERGLLCVNIGHPFWKTHFDQTELMLLLFDEPDLIRETISFYEQFLKQMIAAACAEGVICFFASQISRNMISPAMVQEYIVPSARTLSDYCRARNAIYYLHDCGKMRTHIEQGLFNDMAPDWLEGLEPPPTGDITDLQDARVRLSPSITIKGSLSIDWLRRATPRQIEGETVTMLENVKGHRHIVGSACSLLPGTPIENIQAMSTGVQRYLGRS